MKIWCCFVILLYGVIPFVVLRNPPWRNSLYYFGGQGAHSWIRSWVLLTIWCCHNFSQHRFSRLFLKFVSFLHHWCPHVRSCPRIRKKRKHNIIISDSSCASPTQNDFSMYVWARSCLSCCAQSRTNRFGNQSEPIGAKGNRREPKAMKPHVRQ